MKKLLFISIAFIFALSLGDVTLAQETTQKNEQGKVSNPAIEKSKGAANTPSIWRMGGVVTAVDSQARNISIHQETVHHDRVMKMKVSEEMAKELSQIKVGDLANVWFNGKVVISLQKVA